MVGKIWFHFDIQEAGYISIRGGSAKPFKKASIDFSKSWIRRLSKPSLQAAY
jgi:hypothetical protein